MQIIKKDINLFIFSLLSSLISYGFTLTNFTLSIDNEQTFGQNFSMGLGRWGTNIVRCKIFDGITPYFTLLISLVFLALTAVLLSNFFKFKNLYSFLFCALFLTFPQMAYQLIFTMQADAVSIGFFVSSIGIIFFVWIINNFKLYSLKSFFGILIYSLSITFVISIYQALIFLPLIIFIIYLFLNTFKSEYSIKNDYKITLTFISAFLLAVFLYYLSLKLFCPPIEKNGYLASYVSKSNNDRFVDFYNLLVDNFRGDFYYGEKTFVICVLISFFLMGRYAYKKSYFIIRSFLILLMLIVPFFISFFITNGSNPPRLYVASNIFFSFIIVHFLSNINYKITGAVFTFLISFKNIYFITLLFLSNHKICNHDQQIARKIDSIIYSKYPTFDSNSDYVYFHGKLQESEHDRFKIPNSEVFGGSFFCWDNGSNNRIINFIKFYDIAHYREIDNKETYLKISDSIKTLPIWPNPESIKKIENVVIIKLGEEKGAKLAIE